MPVDNFDSFADKYLSENWEEGEDGRHGGLAVYDKKGDVVDFKAIGEVADAMTCRIGVGNYYYFMTAIGELGGELVDVGFDTAGLRVEEVADHPVRSELEGGSSGDGQERFGGLGRGWYAIL